MLRFSRSRAGKEMVRRSRKREKNQSKLVNARIERYEKIIEMTIKRWRKTVNRCKLIMVSLTLLETFAPLSTVRPCERLVRG